jgi:HD superfamily phosphohydrolase
MTKHIHEVRDPVHVFVRLDSTERAVLDSPPLQRLRHIHQLAMTFLVYPGATHRRFEHSLGVMELASRVFDVVTCEGNRQEACRHHYPPDEQLQYWRRVLRMAALCHDIGHLPFSHAAEKELLPEGWDHERLTYELICSPIMQELWSSTRPAIIPQDIAKLAVEPGKIKGVQLSVWESILSEIIVGSAFGVDRMDYLLRDSLHAGVAYGRFDHHRLVDTLRILPKTYEESGEPALGVEDGGLPSAEALLLARHFMFTQLYVHPVRRIYDLHLQEFLRSWLPAGKYPTTPEEHLRWTDNEVLVGLRQSVADSASPSHHAALRIAERHHFKLLYSGNSQDHLIALDAEELIYNAARKEFGDENVRHDIFRKPPGLIDFPVLTRDGPVDSARSCSEILRSLPVINKNYVFISPEKRDAGHQWLNRQKNAILASKDTEA